MKDLKDTKALQDSQGMLLLDHELLKRDVKGLTAVVALQPKEEPTMVAYRRRTAPCLLSMFVILVRY